MRCQGCGRKTEENQVRQVEGMALCPTCQGMAAEAAAAKHLSRATEHQSPDDHPRPKTPFASHLVAITGLILLLFDLVIIVFWKMSGRSLGTDAMVLMIGLFVAAILCVGLGAVIRLVAR